MDNIGYAIFKKASVLAIDSNGLFEDLQLSRDLNSLLTLVQSGQQLLCFKRIASRKSNPNVKDAYLVILLEHINNNRPNYVLGSAICFKENQVNESKIIDGVHYLLSQLKRNFISDYDINGKDLGVLLPSTNKDFKIFKSEKLVQLSSTANVVGYDIISLVNNDAKSYLHYFQKHIALRDISSLLLSDKILNGNYKGSEINRLNVKTLIQLKELQKDRSKLINESSKAAEAAPTEDIKKQKEGEFTNKQNLFKGLTFLFFGLSIALGILLLINSNNSITPTSDNTIYEVGDELFISYNSYNVNVRSSPNADFGDDNVKNTLSDGDKVFVLGFDKETFWAKIRYDKDQIGYVSNRLISKQIATNRVRPIYKQAIINSGFISAPLYSSPAEIEEDFPTIKLYLKEGDRILIKNQDLRLNSFSVSLEKDNKVFHGFMEKKYFHFE